MDAETVGKLLSAVISGGTASNIALAIAEGLKLANALNEPDPHKRAKARREYYLSMLNIAGEVKDAKSEDIDTLVKHFIKLLDD